MSVVGFDVGNLNCFIAVAKQGGIEVITNDYSLHATPSCISFGSRNRLMGVSAKQQMNSNLPNSITNFKHLLGRKFSDKRTQQIRQWLPCEMIKLDGDNIGMNVTYLGEKRILTPEQVMAALLVKLKETTEQNVRKVTDCVVSVPFYFTDNQRRCLLAATQMADLNCLRIMNETTAVALAYGIYKQDLLPEGEKAKLVVFLDIGHSASQASLVSFNKGKLTTLGATFDMDVGGRDFDGVLREYFRQQFKDNYKIDASTKPRPWLRLLDECEKIKKQMSANSTPIPLGIECFMEEKDVAGKIQRSEFETMSMHLFDRIRSLLRRLLEETRKKAADIDSIEIVGGSSRLPMVRQIIMDMFGQEPKTTMNQDEAVVRGCAMQCAILSPAFRVREFSVKDSQPFRIKISWGPSGLTDGGENDVFQERDEFPFSKILTLYRKEQFVLSATYSLPNQIPFQEFDIGSWRVTNVTPNEEGESRKVKVKVRVNPNGIFSVCSASIIDTVTQVEEVVDTEKTEGEESMDAEPPVPEENGTEEETEATDPPKGKVLPKKPKTKTISLDLPVEERTPSFFTANQVTLLKAQEAKMQATDRAEKEKADAKNSLEEYVYEMRDKLCCSLAEFVEEKDADTLKSQLSGIEEWLYGDGEDEQKSVFLDKLTELKKLSDPIVERHREFDLRQPALDRLGRVLQMARKEHELWLNRDAKYDHIDAEEMKKVVNIIDEKQRWMEDVIQRQSRHPKTAAPIIFAHEIEQAVQATDSVVRPIFNKPKPKQPTPPPPPIAEETKTNKNGDEAATVPEGGADQENITKMELD